MEGGAGSRFTVGSIECVVVADGKTPYQPEMIFAGIPEQELKPSLEGLLDEQGILWLADHCLLIRAGGKVLVVDGGPGELASQMGAPAGRLLDSLRKEGIEPRDVDIVIVSHAHPDHIVGLTRQAGDGRDPVFGNAPHYFWKAEWDFWTSEEGLAQVPEMLSGPARMTLPPLAEAGLVKTVEQETDVVAGVRLLPAPGHTPGHMAVAVRDGDGEFLYVADTVLHPLNVEHPEWMSAFEALPDVALETRRIMLSRAARNRSVVAAYHMFQTGRVEDAGGGFRFEPNR